MTNAQRIKIALAYADMTQKELATRMGLSPSSLSQKIKRESLTLNDMEKIGDILGIEWKAGFVIKGELI